MESNRDKQERTEYLWRLVQEHTGEFVMGLEAGLAAGRNLPVINPRHRKAVIENVYAAAFKSEAIMSHYLGMLPKRNWGANSALLQGIYEGAEYSVDNTAL